MGVAAGVAAGAAVYSAGEAVYSAGEAVHSAGVYWARDRSYDHSPRHKFGGNRGPVIQVLHADEDEL
jgi:hypothetical protein